MKYHLKLASLKVELKLGKGSAIDQSEITIHCIRHWPRQVWGFKGCGLRNKVVISDSVKVFLGNL